MSMEAGASFISDIPRYFSAGSPVSGGDVSRGKVINSKF